MNGPFRTPAVAPPEPALPGAKHAALLTVPDAPPPVPRVWPWWVGAWLLVLNALFFGRVASVFVSPNHAAVWLVAGLFVFVPITAGLGVKAVVVGAETATRRGRRPAGVLVASVLGLLVVVVATVAAWVLGYAT